MRALIQRVAHASVTVDGVCVGGIEQGILLLLGIQREDTPQLADKLLQRVLNYRIFMDEQDKMNLSLKEIKGSLLIVSQFTLAADTHKGLRPGFSSAAKPDDAELLYNYFVHQAQAGEQDNGVSIATGIFGADMQVELLNDGPVTFLLEV